MIKKKLDRFERDVKACYFNNHSHESDAIRLLRNQHRAVVRMVSQEYKRLQEESNTQRAYTDASIAFGLDCQAGICKFILAQLKKRAT